MTRVYKHIVVLVVIFSLVNQLGVSALSLDSEAKKDNILILCYHGIGETDNPENVSADSLRKHFDYILKNNYTPISLDDYIRACKNPESFTLPSNPILLTFDDGYLSFYTEAYPLLKEYNFPAVVAIVTSWLENPPTDLAPLLNWDILKELASSELVDIVSHSHASHNFSQINPLGSLGRTLESFKYENNKYETINDYQTRVFADLSLANEIFLEKLGFKPKVIVWPYGSYTQFSVDIAFGLGYEAAFRLNGGFNFPKEQALREANRVIIDGNLSAGEFASILKKGGENFRPMNASQLDIDMIYDPDDFEQTKDNLDLAISKLRSQNINTVILQAFNDSDGSGDIESVYFYTTAAPVEADIFSYISSRLRNEGFRVYAWMPTLACQWLINDRPEDIVTAYDEKGNGWYRRATPFSLRVREDLALLFADLAAYSYVDGVLFQDDLYFTDYEDFSEAGRSAFQNSTGLTLNPKTIKNSRTKKRWTEFKTQTLIDLTTQLTAVMKEYRPQLKTARNIYAVLITDPKSEEWFAQNYDQFLTVYDYTVIMAYPYLEGESENPIDWLEKLTYKALKNKNNAPKTVFKLQTYDWENEKWLNAEDFKKQRQALKDNGAINMAHYPENVFSE